MGLFDRFRNKGKSVTSYRLVTEVGNGFYSWDGNVYKSDIVRACIHPKVRAIGKVVAKHIYTSVNGDGSVKTEVNPDAYIRFLLEEPNPYMSGQKLQEKVAAQLCLNNNAFILIIRDTNGLPCMLFPISASSAEAVYAKDGTLFLRFIFRNGNNYTFPYSDIIHLRDDFYENDIFGTPKYETLLPLMDIVTTTDQGIIKAIKNSNILRWLLKIKQSQRDEDTRAVAERFASNYLSLEKGAAVGVAAVDAKVDAQQVTTQDYVPNSAQMEKTTDRIYSLFNTNKNIVQSSWTEDQWNAYYEAEIEPVVCDLSNEYTRKLFTRRERAFGNKIVFESSNLQYANNATKLNFVQLVDRGAMTPNEWRSLFNFAPVPGGDEPIRRLDTAVVENSEEKTEKETAAGKKGR